MKKLIYLFLAILIVACSSDDSSDDNNNINNCEYIINTLPVTNAINSSVTFNGVIGIDGNCEFPIIEQGFVYATSIQPTLNNNQVNVNGTDVTITINNLEPNTTYYVRTFLTNSLGEFYGNELSFQIQQEAVNIGDVAYGGVVFWIDPNDNQHGLVCAFSDYKTKVEWGCIGLGIPNLPNVPGGPDGPGAEIGDGVTNTNAILQGCPNAPAALAARSLGTEWFLPSSKELHQMYINKTTLEAVDGFDAFNVPEYYWSSTQEYASRAWTHRLTADNQYPTVKNSLEYVRAVRSF
ncbi:DUF1566 domain-containing protein [Flavobacteriaceae bacterium]|nr:DUF1566 domain-containing protein [Flavobacteriaceae bacterium]